MKLYFNIVINELLVLHTISWNKGKKIGFPVCKKENVAAFQHTKTVRAFVPVLLRVTHQLKSGVLVSSPILYSPFLRFTYDWKPYCYSTVSITLSCIPVLFPHFAFINFSEKSRVLYQVFGCPKSWKVPQRKKSCPRWARELNIFPALFVRVNRPITRCDVWQFLTQVTKLKVCWKIRTRVYFAQHCATTCKTKIC